MNKSIKFWSHQFQRIHFGQIMMGKVSFILTFVNLIFVLSIKYNFNPIIIVVLSVIVGIMILWLLGYWADVSGFKDGFESQQQRVIIQTIEERFKEHRLQEIHRNVMRENQELRAKE